MRKKIQYNLYPGDNCNASGKAKSDAMCILKELGFQNLYTPSRYRAVRVLQQFVALLSIPRNSVLVIQYPGNIPFFYKLLYHLKKVKKIALIHDLQSYRGLMDKVAEMDILNSFDELISHNVSMTKSLKENGCKRNIVELNVFDYLLDDNITVKEPSCSKTVFFAGNLEKSYFLNYLSNIKDVSFNLYGKAFKDIDILQNQENVNYKGSFTSEKLIENIEGSWGLVWDGDSLDTCTGTVGEYMRFNNPHKVSMCIVSERPIVIWKESAMARYIEKHQIGITIGSLSELPDILSSISEDVYLKFVGNIRKQKEILVKGLSLKNALKKTTTYNEI